MKQSNKTETIWDGHDVQWKENSDGVFRRVRIKNNWSYHWDEWVKVPISGSVLHRALEVQIESPD